MIQTERLVLRQLELNDADFILELLNEAAFLRFIGDKGVRTLDAARDYLSKGPIDSYGRHGFGLYAYLYGANDPVDICHPAPPAKYNFVMWPSNLMKLTSSC